MTVKEIMTVDGGITLPISAAMFQRMIRTIKLFKENLVEATKTISKLEHNIMILESLLQTEEMKNKELKQKCKQLEESQVKIKAISVTDINEFLHNSERI